MSVKVEIIGQDRLRATMRSLEQSKKSKAGKVLTELAFDIHGLAVKSIQSGSKTGNTYTRGGVAHQASAPGEAPATDTGNLVRNIQVETGVEGGDLVAVVTVRAPYAAALEFGTVNMEPRPYLRPAFKEATKNLAAQIREALKE